MQAGICAELIRRLLEYGPALHQAAAAVAELDCLVSLAATARDLGYCRPQLTTDNVLHITQGEPGCAWSRRGARHATATRPLPWQQPTLLVKSSYCCWPIVWQGWYTSTDRYQWRLQAATR
jgi:hypothetical protein